jgi:large subunit ribosomal protein L9e
LAVSFTHPKKDLIKIELHHGSRKAVATIRTVRTLIVRRIIAPSRNTGEYTGNGWPEQNNLIIGVTKGYKYKMRYVYAHFPINVNIEKNSSTDQFEVEIRNFVGEKLVRRVVMRPGVDVEPSKNVKDQLELTGNVGTFIQ